RLSGDLAAPVLQPGRMIGQEPGRLDIGRHVSHSRLHLLEIADALTKLATLSGKVDTGIQAGLAHPHSTRRSSKAPGIEGRHRYLETGALLTQKTGFRQAALSENQMGMVGGMVAQLTAGQSLTVPAGNIGLYQEGRDALMPPRGIASGEDNGDVGDIT